MLAILFHYFSYAQPYLRHGKEVQAVDYYTLWYFSQNVLWGKEAMDPSCFIGRT